MSSRRSALRSKKPDRKTSADVHTITLRLNTERLRMAVQLLADYHPEAVYPQVWHTLNAELGRRTGGAAWRAITIDRRHLSGLPFAVKEILQVGSRD